MSQAIFLINYWLNKVFRSAALFMAGLLLASCISHHKALPPSGIGAADIPKQYDLLAYRVEGAAPEGFLGGDLIRSALGKKAPFLKTHEVADSPTSGVFCRIEIIPRPPGKAASVFGYVSLFSLGLLPSWSLQEGYDIRFHLSADGQTRGQFEYQIRRQVGLWLGLIPFVWVNLLNPSEKDVVEGAVVDFLVRADPVFYSVEKNRIADTPEF